MRRFSLCEGKGVKRLPSVAWPVPGAHGMARAQEGGPVSGGWGYPPLAAHLSEISAPIASNFETHHLGT